MSAPTVTVTLQRLARDGFVEIGATGASPSRRRARTWPSRSSACTGLERWLTDVLGLDWAAADEEAQRLASGVSELVADRLDDETLGYPATCPHGNVVLGREPPYGELVALSDLQPGAGTRAPHLGGRRA